MKTIALLEWNVGGHHEMFFRLFSRAIRQIGCDAVEFCPNRQGFCPADGDDQLPGNRHYAGPIRIPANLKIRPRRFQGPLNSIRRCRAIAKAVRAWESSSQRRIDLLFFCCIYDIQFCNFEVGERFLKRPYAGLYLQARTLRMPGTALPGIGLVPTPEKMFTGKNLKALAILDEGRANAMSKLIGKKPVFAFPDLTTVGPDLQNNLEKPLLKRVIAFANGRPIVTCCGFLQKSKGLLRLIEAARGLDPASVCFVFVGQVHWLGFSDQEAEELKSANQLQNVFTHFDRIDDETFDGLVATTHIVSAVYEDFPHSSNILAKAAAHRKPVIVNDGYLMADRVREYRLGEIVSQNSNKELVEAILRLTNGEVSSCIRAWDAYLNFHSYATLVEQFRSLIGQALGSESAVEQRDSAKV